MKSGELKGFISELQKLAHTSLAVPAYFMPMRLEGQKKRKKGKLQKARDHGVAAMRGGLTGASVAGLVASLQGRHISKARKLVGAATGLGAAAGVADHAYRHHEQEKQAEVKMTFPQSPFSFTPGKAKFRAQEAGRLGTTQLPRAVDAVKESTLPLTGNKFRFKPEGVTKTSEEELDDFLKKEGIAVFSPVSPNLELKSRQHKEMELWKTWDSNGRKPKDLKPLLDSMAPLIQSHVDKWKVEIPTAAIEAKAHQAFVRAAKTYDPSRGQFNTHLGHQLKGLSRYVKTYQNVGKIPDKQIEMIHSFKKTVGELKDELGYEPGSDTIAQRLGVSQKKVQQLQKELKGTRIASELMYDPAQVAPSKITQAIDLLQYDTRLTPLELKVLQHTHGLGGAKLMSASEIAKHLKNEKGKSLSNSKVSRIRKKISDLLNETAEAL